MIARAHWQDNQLSILLEGDEALNQAETVPIIRRGLMRLGLTCPPLTRSISSVARWGKPPPTGRSNFWLAAPGATAQAQSTAEGIANSDAAAAALDNSGPAPGDNSSDNSTEALMSDHALLALAQLGPLFGYLMVLTNGMIGFPLVWWGQYLSAALAHCAAPGGAAGAGARFSLRAPSRANPPSIFSYR